MHSIQNRYRRLPTPAQERVQAISFGIFISICSIIAIAAGISAGAEVGKIAGSILGVEIGYAFADYTRKLAKKF